MDADNPKAIWQSQDPKQGIDFYAFKQSTEPANADGSCPQSTEMAV